MNTIEFVNYLRRLDINLFIEGDHLRCNAPEGTLTPKLKSAISDRKTEIISFLQQANLQTNITAIAPIFRTENNTFPLSFAQQRLWFVNQLQPHSPSYNMPFGLQFRGQLNIAALESSLQLLINRHEIFRTNFITVDGKPLGAIAATRDFTLPVIDLRPLPPSEQELEYQKLASDAAKYVFDLAQDPLLRTQLVQLTPTESVLLLTIHHIIFDAWSVNIFLKELTTAYSAYVEHHTPNLPEIHLQYVDFAVWQQQWLQGEVLESQLAYWQQKLALMPTLLELPSDRPRTAVQSFCGATQVFSIEQNISDALVSLSQQQGVTLFMLLLTAFKILLYRYTNQSDIVVGTPVANRQHSQIQGMIGFFVNNLVLRTDLSDDPTFLQLLQQVKKVVIEAYDHQNLPFEKLVEALHPERNLSYTPLFQIDFALEHEPVSTITLKDLTINISDAGVNHTAKFDLGLSLQKTEQGLTGAFEYSTDLFDAATITRMVQHWQTLLAGIVGNPEQKLSNLPILSAIEQHKLLVEWNKTQQDYPHNLCIHQLFEAQVEQTPDAVAVIFKDEQLTYRELNAKANQLAHYLQTLGVKPETLVGICVERSLEMIVGLLGILKAGGAYVPLDPMYPQERLAFMLEDSAVPVLLTQQRLVDKLPKHEAQVVCLDTQWEAISEYSEKNIGDTVNAQNLAYVIYTSGSTGKPKGVTIPHLSVVNYITAVNIEYGIKKCDSFAAAGSADRILQFSSISFDVSAEEIYTSLTSGATLVLRTDSMLDSVGIFLQKCRDWKLTVLVLPTAYWHELTLFLSQEKFTLPLSLRLVIIGGEKALTERLQTWLEYVGQRVSLVNNYGPTEATIGATIYDLSAAKTASAALPIGRPIRNVQTYVLDRSLQPVPIGIPGELYIGGDGLARGYLNQPDLTEEKFIPNPFSKEPGSRLYKTGDKARYLPDGNIEFIGRIDNQVKIRGFRIELGEIEAVLNAHPQIQQAVVIVTEDIPGDKRLVAYLVKSDEFLTNKQIRDFLKQQLPEYMLPSVFVTLDTIPLTPNGKIDKKALPIPDGVSREVEYIAPRTPSEEIIANIFATVLNQQNIGINDNFFSLGGHSLLATQLISRLRLAFSLEIPLRAVFESPTVTQLDIAIAQLRSQERGLILPPIQAIEGDREQLPLSWAQERLWFLNQLEGASATYNMPAAVKIAGDLDINALQQALSEIVHRHEILRTSIQTVNGLPIQVIHPQVTTSINVVDLQQLLAPERETLLEQQIQLEASIPFNLENAPLIRCILLQVTDREYVLLLTMHHIVSDGWSMGIFISELSSLYAAFCAGDPSPLPALPLQYADFAVWQKRWLSGVVLETQLNYWRSQLQGSPELLQLPTDRPRPVVQTYHGRTQSFELNQDLTQKLQSLSAESGTTLFMTMLAAFVTLLYRYSGQSDILVGTPIANRNRNEIESLIGFFVNTLVLRSNFENNPSFESLLAQVRETTLQAYEHQDVPFEQVVEALQPQRSLSHSPLFQVMFVLQNVPMTEFELPGVTLTQLDGDSTIAKFDLTLSMSETDRGLVGEWEYNTDLFDGSTIERMTAHFQNLLSAIVANPAVTVGELALLSAAERHQLLVEWNDTTAEYPIDKCIHQLFEAQVEKTPDAVAVVFEDQQLTYRELNQRANQLAHYLQTLGVRPEVLVGICVERSLEMVVGLLGILKAGGAYVPLDPEYPRERLDYMLADAGVEVLLTQLELLSSLSSHTARVVYLDTDWYHIAQDYEKNPISDVISKNLAYTIYTSGSTGKPKGVQIIHSAVVNFLCTMRQQLGITADDVLVGVTTFNFDIAMLEIFLPMIVGARVVIAKREVVIDGQELLEMVANCGATVMQATPATWRLLLEAGWQNSHQLKILCGGEALHWELANQLLARSPSLWNLYGPTETTIWSLIAQIESQSRLIVIGRPMSNTQIYILDANQQPVPIGVPGELYIGGDGLARGYLNRPELTLEKFIPNPFSHNLSARLYKTGDLACYLIDGNIEYLGRIDNQVKIRGFRIELGEIEAVLNAHPQIQQAVVIVTEDIPGDKRLVAYLVKSDEFLTNKQIR
ncbi:MAG: non-ribosomal peptide synthetase, partial [Anabaena sp. MDT14b]